MNPENSPETENVSETVKPYQVDAASYKLTFNQTIRNSRIALELALKPVTQQMFLGYSDKIVRENVVRANGETEEITEVAPALVFLFNEVRKNGIAKNLSTGTERELTLENVRDLPDEQKISIADIYLACSSEIVEDYEDDLDALFYVPDSIKIQMTVGDDKFVLLFTPPNQESRNTLRAQITMRVNKREGKTNKTIFKSRPKLLLSFFDKHFQSAQNCLIEGQPFSDELRAEFLAALMPQIKTEAVECLLGHFEKK